MLRAYVLHWDAATLEQRLDTVRAAGAEVAGAEAEDGGRAIAQVEALRPDVLVATLAHRPTRTVAAALQSYAWGRNLPVLLVDDSGSPLPKREAEVLRQTLPGAMVVPASTLKVWLAKVQAALLRQRNAPTP
jgi:chemotaxis response regulator CheB